MDILQALRSISSYPIPLATIEAIAEEEGLDIDDEASQDVLRSYAYLRAKGAIYQFLAGAPNVSQGGISYSFSSDERDYFLSMASRFFSEAGEEGRADIYGYVGEDF